MEKLTIKESVVGPMAVYGDRSTGIVVAGYLPETLGRDLLETTVACYNACQEIRPFYPQLAVPELLDLLHEAKLQLEYLDDKFESTGTSAALISRISNILI